MKRVLTFLALITLTFSTYGQFKRAKPKSIFRALQQNKIVTIALETNLDSLINHRNRNTYQKGFFTYADYNGKVYRQAIKLRPRGKFRRRICHFPMIKIDFPKSDLKKQGYAKYDDYKLVTHCMNNLNASYESVAREYLAYKLYNILSPNSYKVQFLYINYIDSKRTISDFQHFGFIIEDTAELSNRIGGKSRKQMAGLTPDSLNIAQHDFVALFQYLIGNTDWVAYPIPRNIKAIKSKEATKYTIVPFDFDFSGLVGAPYAVPSNSLNQRSIRHRIFQGISKDKEDLDATIKHFLSKKRKILRYIRQYTLLSRKSRKSILKYIESFFEEIESGFLEEKR